MSYALAFAPDARTQWQELDPWLQELVLDEADLVASAPPVQSTVVYRDVVRTETGQRHYLFLRFTIDDIRKCVTMIGVAHFIKPENPPSGD